MEDLHKHDLPAASSDDKMEWTLELHSHRGDNAKLKWKGTTEHFAVFREGFPAISSNITEQVFFLAPSSPAPSHRVEIAEMATTPLFHAAPTQLQLPPARSLEPETNSVQNSLEGNPAAGFNPETNTVIQPSYTPSSPSPTFSFSVPLSERLRGWASNLMKTPPGESPYKKWGVIAFDVAAGVFLWVGLCNSPWTQAFMKGLPVIGGNGSIVQATINATKPKVPVVSPSPDPKSNKSNSGK